MSKTTQQEVRKDAMVKIGLALLVVLVLANTIQLARFGGTVESAYEYYQGTVDELGGFREDIVAFGNDMNEMRSYLLLPTKNYSFMEGEEVLEEDTKEGSTTEKALYQFLGTYADEQRALKNFEAAQQEIANLNTNEELKTKLSEEEMVIGPVEQSEESSTFKVLSGKEALFAVVADKNSGTLRIQSAIGSEELSHDNAARELATYAMANKEKVMALKELLESKKAGMANLTNNQKLQQVLTDKNISFQSSPDEDENGFHYHFLNVEGTTLLTIDLMRDGHYQINGKEYESEEQMAVVLIDELGKIDASTGLEKMISERRAELETIFQEPAFQELLSSNNLSVSSEPREEYNKLLYDVKDADGNLQFSFVIELSSGLFKVLRNNEEIDLYSVLLGSKKKP